MREALCCALWIAAVMIGIPADGQQLPATEPSSPVSAPAAPSASSDIYGGYLIGVGDILDIRVADEDSITGRYQVDPNGHIQLPLLTGAISASGQTTFELAKRIQGELKKQDILREPSVTVFIARGMSQTVTVLGAVVRPGIYPLEQPTTVLDLISRAGGLQANAGREVTIAHRSDAGGKPVEGVVNQTADLPSLFSGERPSSDLLVRSGDVVTVTTAPVVFVVGAVVRPGAFTVQGPKAEMTVLQAVAMAEGVLPTAAQGRTVIVRQSSDESSRQEIPIDLTDVIRGKSVDQVLLANDILFVPQSGAKVAMRRVGDIAVQAASQVAGYGLGIRIGR